MRNPGAALSCAGEYIEKALGEWKVVGAAVAVVRASEIIYSRGFGLRRLGSRPAVDDATLFEVGSTTKAFTTAALAILVEEGRMQWDDPVKTFVPDLQLQDPWITRHLTVRDIVTHRSGLAESCYPFLAVMSPAETIASLTNAASVGQFRDCYCYGNLMYALAGSVVEAASGATWGEFVQERLLDPLDMKRSGSSPYQFWDSEYIAPTFFGSMQAAQCGLEHARDGNVAMPHGWDENGKTMVLGWQSYDNAAAAGSLISSAAEMANWLILHVEEGCFRSRQILRRDSVKELHAIQNSRTDPSRPLGAGMHPDAEAAEGYAMGWHRGTYCGRLHLYHSGGILGFPAYAAFMPGQKFGVVALANGPRSVRDDYAFNKAIAFWIFDRLLGEPETDWSRQYLSWMQKVRNAAEGEEAELQRTRVSSAPPSRALQEYAGVYEDCAGQSGPVVVDVREGDLALSFAGAGAYSALLEHWHYDLFRMRSNPVADEVFDKENMYGRFVCFSTDPKGKRIIRAFGGEFRQQGD